MSDKLVMGYWDCSQCDAKGVEGTKRECPYCGRPRGKDVTFYMKRNEKRYLTAEESRNKGKGEDWLCTFCETLNSATTTICKSCGAEKNSENKTYSEVKKDKKNTSDVLLGGSATDSITHSSFSKLSIQNILLRSIPILIASVP